MNTPHPTCPHSSSPAPRSLHDVCPCRATKREERLDCRHLQTGETNSPPQAPAGWPTRGPRGPFHTVPTPRLSLMGHEHVSLPAQLDRKPGSSECFQQQLHQDGACLCFVR